MELKPFPSKTYKLFQEFQIWGKVSAYLRDPLAITAAYQTCPFRDLLEERLFAEVFKILKENQYLYLHATSSGTEHYGHWSRRLRKTSPKSTCGREQNRDVWNLRAVSKSFKRIMESTFLNVIFEDSEWHNNFQKIITSLNCSKFKEHYNPHRLQLSNSGEIKNALDALKNASSSSKSTFLQAVHVKNDKRSQRRTIFRPFSLWSLMESLELETLKFFKIHGGYISGLIFECDRSNSDPVIEFKYILNLLKLTPNLKALFFKRSRPIKTSDECDPMHENFMKENPFPVLKKVRLLWFDSKKENSIWISGILKNCPNLKALRLPFAQNLNEGKCGLEDLLKSFPLEIYEPNRDIDQSYLLSNADWQLKRLILGNYVRFDLTSHFFRTLEQRFGQTLEHLEIKKLGLGVHYTLQNIGRSLKLPKLKTLYLGEINFGLCNRKRDLDWITTLKSLKYLEIECIVECICRNRTGAERVNLATGRLNVNNIWPEIQCVDGCTSSKLDRRSLSFGLLSDNHVWRLLPNLREIKIGYMEGKDKLQRVVYNRSGCT